jgi:hypothetical protein|tara:strand:+ start:251 stop:451 length:201 start_codon:yes stop_codon:yes gene_type:complete
VTKVTLDDVEYESENFSESQKKILNEILYNKKLSSNLSYQVTSLNVVSEILSNKLKTSLKKDKTND